MSSLYLAAIVVSLLGMGVLDRRWRVFLFDRPWLAAAVVGAGAAFFLVWDLVAIDLDIYRRGESRAMTGVEVASELPLEEIFFVVFLGYCTMVVHGLARRVARR